MKAVHANCSNCGAALMLESDRRITTCGFCNARLLVEIEGFMPRYWFPPAVDSAAAAVAAQRALRDSLMPKDLVRRASLDSRTLTFIPFYRFRARRVGMIVSRGHDVDPTTGETLPVKVDTKVVFNTLSMFGIATDVPGWGIEHLDVERVAGDDRFPAKPYRATELQKIGEVFETTRTADRFVAERIKVAETQDVTVNVSIHPEELSVWYYPVWLVRYTYKGMVYRVSVDALSGEVLLARAPQTNRHRLPLMLVILSLLSFPASRLVNYVRESRDPTESASAIGYVLMIVWPLTFMVLSAVMLVLYLSWMNYRYAGEVVMTPRGRDIEKLGKPVSTWVERAFERLDAVQERFLDWVRRYIVMRRG